MEAEGRLTDDGRLETVLSVADGGYLNLICDSELDSSFDWIQTRKTTPEAGRSRATFAG